MEEAAAGESIGTGIGAFWGPVGAKIGGSIGKGVGMLAGPPPPSSSSLATYGTSIGNDGWNVTFGDSSGVTSRRETSSPNAMPDWLGNQFDPSSTSANPIPVQAGYSMPTWAVVGVLAVLAVRAIRSKK